jgi:iron donor protein CyaY
MSPENSRFDTLAEQMLEKISDAIERVRPDADYDLEHGILSIVLPGGVQVIINKQSIAQEIWVASPASGGHHFRLDDEDWVSTRDPGRTLSALLSSELGISV